MIARASGLHVVGFLDDGPLSNMTSERVARLGLGVVGPTTDIANFELVAIGIGDPQCRERFDRHAESAGLSPVALIHPTAYVGEANELGEGTVLFPGAVLTTNVNVGRQTHINSGATINHDCVLGSYVTISPGVRVAGNVTIGKGAFLGIGCCILPGVTIGARAVIGAGAVVTCDVAPGDVVAGVPARSIQPSGRG